MSDAPHTGKRTSDYEAYIRTAELLALQKPAERRVHPDELLFQVMHQVMELWLKVVFDETVRVAALLERDQLAEAAHHLRRISKIEVLLQRQFEVLETMPPADYHVIRLQALGRGSGQESPGFRAMLQAGEPVWRAFEGARERRGLALSELFRDPRRAFELWLVVQGMMEVDEGFQAWRFHHLGLVKRIIGLEVKSLKGVPAAQLRGGLDESFFPELWQQVPALTRETRPGY